MNPIPRAQHPLYHCWIQLNRRCSNPQMPNYHNYGGRGITVCPEWAADFWAFHTDMWEGWAPGLTIDRIDNNLGYSPENCQWVTQKENCANRRPRKINQQVKPMRYIRKVLNGYRVSVTMEHRDIYSKMVPTLEEALLIRANAEYFRHYWHLLSPSKPNESLETGAEAPETTD